MDSVIHWLSLIGIGSADGCVVVQMQEEINQINNTLREMKPRLDEIERYCRL